MTHYPILLLNLLHFLENNNINEVHSVNFANFVDLEILDLNGNHISNWYERVFESNIRLNIVNLRNNNINLMTAEMMHDFSLIKFLAIGANSFVCDCSLREFIDRATFNAKVYQCGARRSKRSLPEVFYDPKYHYDVFLREYHSYVRFVDESFKNIVGEVVREAETFSSRNLDKESVDAVPINCDGIHNDSDIKTMMTFNFLLLDYNENDYHCIESDGSSKTKVFFVDIKSCPAANEKPTVGSTQLPGSTGKDDSNDDLYGVKPEKIKKAPNTLLILYISIGIPLTFVGALWFWKRRDIKYFCAIFKNTLILSFDKDDKKALMMKNRRKSNTINDDNYRFDLFVSYSDKDREFVLDQLIPNLEKRSEITICLHERDFQVGLSILENIIQCMDQSRCLLLVISESFIKSNWCSFEMHLAQHRLVH